MAKYATIDDFEENLREEVEYTLFDQEQFLGAIDCANRTKLILTDQRIIEFNRGLLRQSTESFAGDEIASVDYQKELLTAKITIGTTNSEETYQFTRNEGQKFASAARNQFVAPGRGRAKPVYQNTRTQRSRSNGKPGEQSTDDGSIPTAEATLRRLQGMDDYDFEHFVADLWSRMGWSTKVSQASVDAGIDVIASKDAPYPQKQLIQAKRYKSTNSVGGPDIQQYASLKHQEDSVDSVVVVTTSSFTNYAEERAEELNVKLVDGDDLVSLIRENEAGDLLERYALSRQEQVPNTHEEPKRETPEPAGGSALGEYENVPTPSQMDVVPELDDIDETDWVNGVKGGTVVWGLGLLAGITGVSGGPLASLLSLAMLVCWVVLPVSVYKDVQYVSRSSSWSPRKRAYVLGAAFPFLNAIVGFFYLYRRSQVMSNEAEKSERAVIQREIQFEQD